MFRKAYQHGLVGLYARRLRGDGCERLAQCGLCVTGEVRNLCLEGGSSRHASLTCADISKAGERTQNLENLFFRNFTWAQWSSLPRHDAPISAFATAFARGSGSPRVSRSPQTQSAATKHTEIPRPDSATTTARTCANARAGTCSVATGRNRSNICA